MNYRGQSTLMCSSHTLVCTLALLATYLNQILTGYDWTSFLYSSSKIVVCCPLIFLYSSCFPCSLTYSEIVSSLPCSPTVLTKYPLEKNFPPHKFSFTWGHFSNILFITQMICVGVSVETDCTKCRYSMSNPTLRNLISYLNSIPSHVSLSTLSTSSSNTILLYFCSVNAVYSGNFVPAVYEVSATYMYSALPFVPPKYVLWNYSSLFRRRASGY